MEKGYRIRVLRGEVEFEVEGDKQFVIEMLDHFESGHGSTGGVVSEGDQSPPKPNVIGKALSSREFLQKLGFKKHTDIVLSFGFFLEHDGDKTSFTPADINNSYYEAKMEKSNTSQMIIQNIKSGRMMVSKKKDGEKSARKSYVLTDSGESFIKKKLASTK